MEGKQLPTLTKHGTYALQLENCVPMIVLGVIVDTSPRSDATAASGDRQQTASGDREQDIPHWLQPLTDGRRRIWIIQQVLVKQSPEHFFHIFQGARNTHRIQQYSLHILSGTLLVMPGTREGGWRLDPLRHVKHTTHPKPRSSSSIPNQTCNVHRISQL